MANFEKEAGKDIPDIEKSSHALQNLINFDSVTSQKMPDIEKKSQHILEEKKIKPPYKPCSQHHEAICVIKENRITPVPEKNAFIVTSTDGKREHLTKVYPTEYCTCAAIKTCYHIIAAKMSLGIPPISKPEPVNLSMVSKRNRKANDRKSGRKKPRPDDVEVVPASDSIFMESSEPVTTPYRANSSLEKSKTSKGKKKSKFDTSPSPATLDISPTSMDRDIDIPELSKEQLSPKLPCLSRNIKKEKQDLGDEDEKSFSLPMPVLSRAPSMTSDSEKIHQ